MGKQIGHQLRGQKSPQEMAAEAKECFDRRVAGQRIDQIALALGISHGTVVNRLKAGTVAAVSPSVEAYRAQQDARLDAVLAGLVASMEGQTAINPQVAMAIVRVEERRAKLHGLDAAIKVEAEHTVLTPEDVALREMMSNARARQEEPA